MYQQFFSSGIVDVQPINKAKIIVYGVLYGQSSGALAQQLGNSRAAADRTHGTVLRTYPKLRNYIERVKRDCKQHGYVETLLGRRRYLTQINSNDNKERARAERQAVNTVCQGSAADLLKLAATNIAARLERCRWMSKPGNTPSVSSSADNTSAATSPLAAQASRSCCRFPDDRGRTELARCPPCRLVLSIHDELVYEVLESRAAEVAQIVRSCMEGAVSLTVPLVAQPRHGSTWGSMTLFD